MRVGIYPSDDGIILSLILIYVPHRGYEIKSFPAAALLRSIGNQRDPTLFDLIPLDQQTSESPILSERRGRQTVTPVATMRDEVKPRLTPQASKNA
jgi:hypothetical protein